MEKILKNASKGLHISEEKLLEESINSFLDRELRKAHSEIEKLKEKYGVKSTGQLEEKIKKMEEGHPAWEELIEWENLEKQIKEINKWRTSITA